MSYPYVQILKETIIFCEKTKGPNFISLRSLGWPGTHYVEQVGLELTEILLLLRLEWLPIGNKAPLSRALLSPQSSSDVMFTLGRLHSLPVWQL